jgi:hypothetical protein
VARCPFAVQKIIPPGSNDPRIKGRVAILHVAVSLAASLFEFFRDRSGGIESHFYVRLLGRIEQYRDTDFEADANYLANPFAWSIETAGMGILPWTRRQRRSLQRLLLWLRDHEGLQLQKIQVWDGRGVGYHVQFGAPGKWTNVAKSCPGKANIRLYNEWLVPWMRQDDPRVDPTRGELRARRRLARAEAALRAAREDRAADKAELESSRARVRRILGRVKRLRGAA